MVTKATRATRYCFPRKKPEAAAAADSMRPKTVATSLVAAQVNN